MINVSNKERSLIQLHSIRTAGLHCQEKTSTKQHKLKKDYTLRGATVTEDYNHCDRQKKHVSGQRSTRCHDGSWQAVGVHWYEVWREEAILKQE